jgi:hypothetical protein
MTADQVRIELGKKIPKEIRKDRNRLWTLQWVFLVALTSFIAEIVCWAIGVIK